jgi:hypothetical protein
MSKEKTRELTAAQLMVATKKMVVLLEPLGTERSRVIRAAFTLLNDTVPVGLESGGGGGGGNGGLGRSAPKPGGLAPGNEKAYFDRKDPQSKMEELAVAARYREEMLGATSSGKEDLKAITKAARRNFDDNNFSRDVDNARRKAGFFTRGSGKKDVIELSYYGQEFVDALPDREAAKGVRKPKQAGGRRPNKQAKG